MTRKFAVVSVWDERDLVKLVNKQRVARSVVKMRLPPIPGLMPLS